MKSTGNAFQQLTEIVDTLMSDTGCPWDRVQTRETLKPYLVEETYEALEALDANDPERIKDELGDLLYQILFHAKISEQRGEFDMNGVIESISQKMIRRHPHVFDKGDADTPEKVVDQWEEIKKTESAGRSRKSVLDGIPAHLPALARSQKLQKKAAKSGFDWDDIEDVFAKLDEEVAEFKEAVRSMDSQEATSELGDMLFVMVNIAKFKKLDAEEALRQSNNKFIRRFQHIEAQAASLGRDLKSMTLEEMETYWQEAKGKEI
ncbi:MAG: nucleoside triphosphate pyrophosphohydrolase [Candidatus Nitrohelix vancouverensis]|uniref:Nucleoside triphosphate pyrophosphohydrolase n=1 Tax=Candidatus Nitrohelix vancouverensis TaxID=2705534 RepID=A0A7T0C4D8_9BACT|nr:MAG: nucleoside triphosphate pyrophosphohydrolase [Candidatus Nitrohelix vancouverensis]